MRSEARIVGRVLQSGLARGRPLSLGFNVTMRCNARCKMCLYWEKIWGPDSENRKALTLEQIDAFSRSMGSLLKIELAGGEPFLREDIGDILLTMGRNCRPLLLTVDTNGSLPEEVETAAAAFCKSNPSTMLRLNLSVDAHGAQHDEIRRFAGLYERCRETMDRLRVIKKTGANISTNITSVVSSYNCRGIGDTLQKIREDFRPDYHQCLLARGTAPEKEALDVPVEAYEQALESVRYHEDEEYTFQHALGDALRDHVSRLVVEITEQKRQVIPCVGGAKHILISDDGTILPCDVLEHFLKEHGTSGLTSAEMAKLADHDYSVPRALNSPQARSVRDYVRAKQCYCTSDCAIISGLLLCPRHYPRLGMAAIGQWMRKRR